MKDLGEIQFRDLIIIMIHPLTRLTGIRVNMVNRVNEIHMSYLNLLVTGIKSHIYLNIVSCLVHSSITIHNVFTCDIWWINGSFHIFRLVLSRSSSVFMTMLTYHVINKCMQICWRLILYNSTHLIKFSWFSMVRELYLTMLCIEWKVANMTYITSRNVNIL